MTFVQAAGPEHKPDLPITYWYPEWFGLSPWASPYWRLEITEAAAQGASA